MGESDLPGLTPPDGPPGAGTVLHLSVDDVLDALLRAAADGGDDPFDAPELAFLRSLHARSGATFDLYLFAESEAGRIEDVPDRFAPAFARAATWLRFGFHGRDAATDYGEGGASTAEARADHDRIRTQARRFAGPEAWTRTIRTHRFHGRAEVVRAWREAEDGPTWLLAPDDDRSEAYALPGAARQALRTRGVWTDAADGTRYAASLPRLESDPRPARTAAAEVARRRAAGGPALACAFTHEPFLRDAEVRRRLAELADWGARPAVRFGRPDDASGQPPDPSAPPDPDVSAS